MPEDCLFCKIASGRIPTERLHEEADLMAFRDIHPQARTHILLIPKTHYGSVLDLPPGSTVMGRLIGAACALARKGGLAEKGFRLVVNTGSDGGQTVPHLHLHLLGGQSMAKPLG